MRRSARSPAALLALAVAAAAAGGCAGKEAEASDHGRGPEARLAREPPGPAPRPLVDPGAAPWVPVPRHEVLATCGLDPELLAAADAAIGKPWAIVRHGRLCHAYATEREAPSEAFSTTKTLAALVAGMVAHETRDIPRRGRKTGPFSDEDRVDHWLDSFEYAPAAHVAHVLAMVAGGTSVARGAREMEYDAIGFIQINTLSEMMNAAIAQDPERLGANLGEFAKRFLFEPLGMTDSRWRGRKIAYTWQSTALDMARVGLLILNGGVWNGRRLVDAEWIRRMTHPAFEDANTGYGYLTWLSSASNYTDGKILVLGFQQGPRPCTPVAVFGTYPHGLSEATDCNYEPPYSCDRKYDSGVWSAIGYGGHIIQGHPGLDAVLVVRQLTPQGTGLPAAPKLWELARPAFIAGDAFYRGDAEAFCEAYGRNEYAPFLRRGGEAPSAALPAGGVGARPR